MKPLLFLLSLFPLSAAAFDEFVVERNIHYLYVKDDPELCRRAEVRIRQDAQYFCPEGHYAYLVQMLSESCWVGDGRVRDSAEGLFRCEEIEP